MYNENYAKLKEVFRDEEFVKKLSKQSEPEDAQAVFAEKGIELTIEELMEIISSEILCGLLQCSLPVA